jgi:hypothetical protein
MAQEDFNIKGSTRDQKSRRFAIYTICTLVIILTVLLDIYFIAGLLG